MIKTQFSWFILCRGMKIFWKSQIEIQLGMLAPEYVRTYSGKQIVWMKDFHETKHKVGSVEFGRN